MLIAYKMDAVVAIAVSPTWTREFIANFQLRRMIEIGSHSLTKMNMGLFFFCLASNKSTSYFIFHSKSTPTCLMWKTVVVKTHSHTFISDSDGFCVKRISKYKLNEWAKWRTSSGFIFAFERRFIPQKGQFTDWAIFYALIETEQPLAKQLQSRGLRNILHTNKYVYVYFSMRLFNFFVNKCKRASCWLRVCMLCIYKCRRI